MPSLDIIMASAAGGALIGLAAALMLLGAGRIAGISGIFFSLLEGRPGRERLLFFIGLVGAALAGVASGWFRPAELLTQPNWPKVLAAGLLVGIGTQLGSGCTSGHGVCGIANFSGRGFTATLSFMFIAGVVVALGFGGLA